MLSTDKIYVSHAIISMYLTHFQKNASEEHQVASTMTRPNVSHAKANTFTIKLNKNVSSSAVASILKMADALNAHYSSN